VDGLAYAGHLVGGEVVEDHDIAGLQRWGQELLDRASAGWSRMMQYL
jgi:hypothetical protein